MAWVQEIYDLLHDPDTVCVACISHGKDSLAMLRAIKHLGLPLHRIVTTDVWATQDIPAVLPEMWEWKTEADKIIKELYGIEVMMEKVLGISTTKPVDAIDCVAKGLSRVNNIIPAKIRAGDKNITDMLAEYYADKNK